MELNRRANKRSPCNNIKKLLPQVQSINQCLSNLQRFRAQGKMSDATPHQVTSYSQCYVWLYKTLITQYLGSIFVKLRNECFKLLHQFAYFVHMAVNFPNPEQIFQALNVYTAGRR